MFFAQVFLAPIGNSPSRPCGIEFDDRHSGEDRALLITHGSNRSSMGQLSLAREVARLSSRT
eukprot:4281658-Amphidinium_carterae.1